MKLSQIALAAFIVGFGGSIVLGKDAATAEGVQISNLESEGILRITINGKLFTQYHYKDVPKPYYYPLLGPDELAMTRKWPMENVPSEGGERDHKHHRSLWYGHQSVN